MRRLPGTEGNDLQWRYQTHGQELTSTHSLDWVLENNNSGSKGYSQTHIGKTKRLYYRPRKLVRLCSLRELDSAKRLHQGGVCLHDIQPPRPPRWSSLVLFVSQPRRSSLVLSVSPYLALYIRLGTFYENSKWYVLLVYVLIFSRNKSLYRSLSHLSYHILIDSI